MDYSQPSVYIWGVRIDEPVTSLTALMIAAECLFAFVRLGKLDKSKSVFYLRYYFLIMAAATANGGIIGHAFLSHLSFAWKLIGWILSMVSVMLIERASIEYASKLLPARISFWLKRINLFELAVFVTVTMATLSFFFVEVHTFYGLLIVVASLHYYVYRNTRSKGSMLFLTAVGFAAISALIYMNEISISKWFNYNDISHVFLSVAAWFFYQGSRKIGEETLASTSF